MPENKFIELEHGYAVLGDFPNAIKPLLEITGKFPLVIADPPYGNILDVSWDRIGDDARMWSEWMLGWTYELQSMMHDNGALYLWGGIGKPYYRPLYKYLSEVEGRTDFQIANHITWSKKRGYGTSNNYLFTREELIYMTLGSMKKPRMFEVPYLDVLRGYDGYNKKYPAKSPYYRRTNVWMDITELLRGKIHPAEKPLKLSEIMVQVHTKPGEWVLEPFAGSGSAALAAKNLGRKFVVVENDEKSFDAMVERLK
jgi:site-specific DNA-methyltransferase (adenine-specific)